MFVRNCERTVQGLIQKTWHAKPQCIVHSIYSDHECLDRELNCATVLLSPSWVPPSLHTSAIQTGRTTDGHRRFNVGRTHAGLELWRHRHVLPHARRHVDFTRGYPFPVPKQLSSWLSSCKGQTLQRHFIEQVTGTKRIHMLLVV